MLKFITVGAALATILSSQMPSSLLASPKNEINQGIQNNDSNLVVNAQNQFTIAQTSVMLGDSSTNTPVVEKVGAAGTMLAIAAIGGGAVGVILNAKKANNSFNSTLSPQNSENNLRLNEASRKLQKELLRLLHDDRNTANRLISQVKINNPNKSINWCVEKVIYDLERDRGAY